MLNVGDSIKYSGDCTGVIEKIRVISKGDYVNQFEYGGNDEDIVLTLRCDHGTTNFWLKGTLISKVS
jgi:hypothetical protein